MSTNRKNQDDDRGLDRESENEDTYRKKPDDFELFYDLAHHPDFPKNFGGTNASSTDGFMMMLEILLSSKYRRDE